MMQRPDGPFGGKALDGQRGSGVMDLKIAERVRQGWRAELGAPAAFRRPGRHVHVRSEQDPAPAGWVGVVTLWDSTCVSLPPSAPGWPHDLRRRDLDADLTELPWWRR